jgi:AraC family transcriptional regulator, L-rhamnose operon transcriptional activator RhaR
MNARRALVNRLHEAEVFTHDQQGIRLERLDISRTVSAHSHEFALIAITTAGKGTQMTEAGASELSAGSLAVLAPDTWHGYVPLPHIDVTNVYISRELLSRELFWLAGLPRIGPLLSVSGGRRGDAALAFQLSDTTLSSVRASLDRLARAESNFLAQVSVLLELLSLAEPAFELDAIETRAMSATKHRPTVARAIALLHERLDHQWGLRELAQEVALSSSQLVRVFKADTGQSPLSYLQRLRVERLAYLIRTTDLTVSSAARQVGWHDGSFAARRFREAWGSAPGEYRRRYNWAAAS